MNYEIIRNFINGDKDEFRHIYEIYKDKIYRTALLILNNNTQAEDVVQEVFIKIINNIHTLKNPEAFEAWIYKITVNSCRSYFKKFYSIVEFFDFTSNLNFEKIDDSYDPEEYVSTAESSNIIFSEINNLSPKLKVPIILFYYNDLSIKEISKILDISEGTAKSRLHNGKKYLKEALEKKEVAINEI
ncbi:RNA polymerase sigma factor [Clostridium sp. YIM B02551]|uniref:RNA polymerase sigma factor n=1 Tax=Clostridium sp. YIM B02551 TaxID=2910679 RepID=UPI001EEA5A03|nr:RNA polymerase sigma factor [Clostridium sp. YIM B02551]